MPKVSVVIPVYGVEKYIERCVRSLFEQTLDSIEYIFVDDCSPDNSIGVLQKILEEYPLRKDQVKILRHEVNQGVGAARNHGVPACSGDYIIHCDPDDWVDLNMYETMYNKAVETDADMVYCSFFLAIENKFENIKQKNCNSPCEMVSSILSGCCHGGLCNKLYKRKIAMQDFCVPEHIIMTEDVLRNVQMLAKTKKIIFLDQPLYYYRHTPSSITNTRNKKCFESEKEVVNFIEKNIVPIYDCRSSLNVYKRRVLSDAVRFRCIDSEEFRTLYPEAKGELFKRISLHDPLARRILLMTACCCFSLAFCLLQIFLKFRQKNS